MGNRTWVHTDRIDCASARGLHDRLYMCEFMSSPNNKYHLVLQGDGNVVLYESWLWVSNYATWATGTYGRTEGPFEFIMQGDHNLCLYTDGGTCLWHAATNSTGGRTLCLEDDGKLRMYNGDGVVVWCPEIKPIAQITNHGTFEEAVMPNFTQAVMLTRALEDTLLSAKSIAEIKDALKAHVMWISDKLLSALNANYTLLQESEASIAMALITQKDLVSAKEAAGTDVGKLEEKIKALELNIEDQRKHSDRCQDLLADAQSKYDHAQREYEAALKDYETKKIVAISFFWFPIVAIGVGIAAAVSNTDVTNAKTVLDTRQHEADLASERLQASQNQLNALRNNSDNSENQKRALQVRLSGLGDDMRALKARRETLAALDMSLKKHASKIGLAYGGARVLQAQADGRLTLRPLTTTLCWLLNEIAGSGLVAPDGTSKMLADAQELDARIPQFQQLNGIEHSSELNDFIGNYSK